MTYNAKILNGVTFQISNSTIDKNYNPSIAYLTNESYVITWTGIDSNTNSVFAREINQGLLHDIYQVNIKTYDGDDGIYGGYSAKVGRYQENKYIITWSQQNNDHNDYDVSIRLFANGQPITELDVAKPTSSHIDDHSDFARIDTHYAVIFCTASKDNKSVLNSKLVSIDLSQSTNQLKEDKNIDFDLGHSDSQYHPKASHWNSNNAIVSWQSDVHDNPNDSIKAQIFKDDGHGVEKSFTVSDPNYHSYDQSIATNSLNEVLISWTSDVQGKKQVYAQGYVKSYKQNYYTLLPKGDNFLITHNSGDNEYDSIVLALPDNSFLVAWESDVSGDSGIYLQRFSIDGIKQGYLFKLNVDNDISADNFDVALSDAKNLLFTWKHKHDSEGVKAIKFPLKKIYEVTPTVSKSDSVTLTHTDTESSSDSLSNSLSETSSKTESDSQSITQTVSESLSGSESISIRCDSSMMTIHLTYVDIDVVGFSYVGSSEYTRVALAKLQNNANRETSYKTNLVIDQETGDYINHFKNDIQNNKYVSGGTVKYLRDCHHTERVNGTNFNIEKIGFNPQTFVEYDWHMPGKIKNYCFSKWDFSHIEQKVDVKLTPGQCAVARMEAFFTRDVEVNYKAKAIFSGVDKFGNHMHGDELVSAAKCVVALNLDWELSEDNHHIMFNTSGVIRHTVLNDVDVSLIAC